ncbi:MAG: hypothetical protein ABIZ05_01855 [Pseudonocardiaceae bacterium]
MPVTCSATTADAVRQAFATGSMLDLAGADVPAALLIELLAGTPPHGLIPALRLSGAAVRGALALPGVTVPVLVELTDCTFDKPIDLYAANLTGWRLTRCTLPGLRAANLCVRSELALESCAVTGPVVLPDAQVEGPLRLVDTHLDAAAGAHALVGVRLVIHGVLDARGLRAEGEVALSGARVEGNIDLRGARLNRPGGDALEASGVRVGGNLHCDRGFTAQGRVVLAGASVAGSALFSGATLRGGTAAGEPAVLVLPRGSSDTAAALAAERLAVNGNLLLDAGFTAVGSVRLNNARVGGHLRLSGATLGLSGMTLGRPAEPGTANGEQPQPVPVALVADGIEVLGDLEARRSMPRTNSAEGAGPLQAHGQVRLVGARVHGSASLTGVRLHGPGLDVLFADRLRVGGSLFLRWAEITGSIRLHHADIGSTLDCTGARLDAPRRRPDGSIKPSLDARAATIGKDVYASREFTATGGVRLSLAEVSKSVNFNGARLGGPGNGVAALRAPGMTCQELSLRFAEPPRGEVSLAGSVAGAVFDDEMLWTTDGKVDIEDFQYQSLISWPEADVTTRLRWLRGVLPGYDPDPYDHLATSYRDAGHDDRADTVLLAKQRHRHSAHGPARRIWGWLQEWTVGYGYRPWRAALWLAACWLLGSLWFAQHQLLPLELGKDPSWQPVIYTADLLVPVVNLGQNGLWRASGASAWIAAGLTTVGWLLLSTAAAGVTRILTRR